MNQIKVIISDLDGTLYYDGIQNTDDLPLHNKEAIQLWLDAGNIFMLATGRTKSTIDWFKEAHHLDIDMIACNGGEIIMNQQCIFESPISYQKIQRMIRLLSPYLPQIDFVLDMDYTSARPCLNVDGLIRQFYSDPDEELISVHDYFKQEKFSLPSKIFIPVKEAAQQAFFLDLLNTEFHDELSFTRSSSTTIECCNPGINKGFALKKLIEITGWSIDEIAVIGDEENDISMLDLCQSSWVMSHARDAIKAHANHEIDSVASLIHTLLKEKVTD